MKQRIFPLSATTSVTVLMRIYEDRERNFGKGYFVHIGPNIDNLIARATKMKIKPENLLITMLSRYQWMDEVNGSDFRKLFETHIENGIDYLIMPIGIKNKNLSFSEDNLIIDFDFSIKMKNAYFKTGNSIEDNDICKVVLNKPTE